MEAPSLLLAAKQLVVFKGKKVKIVRGNTKIGKERLLGKEIIDIFSWGKHLVFQFDLFALRIHFLLFGTYEATIDNTKVTGDYQRSQEPRLAMNFINGNVKLFNCSIKIFETANLKNTYDFTISIMDAEFDEKKALQKMQTFQNETIDDILLDQDIFAGVGNIIKNEVLFLCKINPHTKINQLSEKNKQIIIDTAKTFSLQFYVWRKEFVLRKHLQIYRKSTCPLCGNKICREKTGKRQRWSYFCPIDQVENHSTTSSDL